jgi:sec-independent protein translocase protein TatC
VASNPEEEKAQSPADEEGVGGGKELPKQTLSAHLKALRSIVLISVIAMLVAFLVIFLGFSARLINFLKAPINARGIELIYISLYESMATQLKVSLIAGIIAASPVVFWQIWSFIKPALYPHEGRIVASLFFITVFLFLLGAVFAYLIVFQMAINFFLVNSEGMAMPFISIEKYVDFLVGFILPFGLTFELPVVMGLLTRAGLVTAATFSRYRKYIIFAIFVLAAILTPPDVLSQILLAIPLILLFETGIIVSRVTQKRAERRSALADSSS